MSIVDTPVISTLHHMAPRATIRTLNRKRINTTKGLVYHQRHGPGQLAYLVPWPFQPQEGAGRSQIASVAKDGGKKGRAGTRGSTGHRVAQTLLSTPPGDCNANLRGNNRNVKGGGVGLAWWLFSILYLLFLTALNYQYFLDIYLSNIVSASGNLIF